MTLAEGNLPLLLGELMEDNGPMSAAAEGDGGDSSGSGGGVVQSQRNAIPLIACAGITSKITLSIVTWLGNHLTREYNVGRKPLYLIGLVILPVRCLMIILLRHSSNEWLMSTQMLAGIGYGLTGLLSTLIIADITIGSNGGRLNLVMAVTDTFGSLGYSISQYVGQVIAEKLGHVASLLVSLTLSIMPIIFFMYMPETSGIRGGGNSDGGGGNSNRRRRHQQLQQQHSQDNSVVAIEMSSTSTTSKAVAAVNRSSSKKLIDDEEDDDDDDELCAVA